MCLNIKSLKHLTYLRIADALTEGKMSPQRHQCFFYERQQSNIKQSLEFNKGHGFKAKCWIVENNKTHWKGHYNQSTKQMVFSKSHWLVNIIAVVGINRHFENVKPLKIRWKEERDNNTPKNEYPSFKDSTSCIYSKSMACN